MAAAGDICNRPTVISGQLREIYERVGFVDVEERIFKMPINGWPKDERLKEIGRMWEANFIQGLSGFSLSMFKRAYDRSPAEIEVRCVTWKSNSSTLVGLVVQETRNANCFCCRYHS